MTNSLRRYLDTIKNVRKGALLVLSLVLALVGLVSINTPQAVRADSLAAANQNAGNVQMGRDTGKKYAVLVAVEAYAWFPGPLKFCLEDLQDIKEVLVRDCGFKPANIFELKDKAATKANLNDVIINRLDPLEGTRDTVVFFFSGHGWPSLFGSGEGLYLSNGIMFDSQLDKLLANLETRKLVVLLDSCFSGGFAGAGAAKSVRGGLGALQSSSGEGIARKLSGDGRVIIAACKASEQSDEYPDLQNGLFTYYLCEALKSRAADADSDRRIDTNEAYDYLEPRVLRYSQDAHRSNPARPVQHPQIYNGLAGGLEMSRLSRGR